MNPRVIHNRVPFRNAVAEFRQAGARVALVPTMGALHEGHFALVRAARERAERIVVSIFVNPTQFAPQEDFLSYPRTLEADLAGLKVMNVDLVWAPAAEDMYPPGFATRLTPEGPALAGLEDATRPHFFSGVTIVVLKLLLQVLPDFAMFGEKDFQQLKVVTRMVADLGIATEIVGVPTVREPDGLALSSRNAYLTPQERAVAPSLYRVLEDCARKIADGLPADDVLVNGRRELERVGFVMDYLEARDAETLSPLSAGDQGVIRLLAAAKLGRTRLIDNVAVAGRRAE